MTDKIAYDNVSPVVVLISPLLKEKIRVASGQGIYDN